MANGYATYKTISVDTADQGKLILICYDAAIRHCKAAIELFGGYTNFQERTQHLIKAQNAIAELTGALNLDVGTVARNLYKIYEYLMYKLVQASVRNEKCHVEEALKHLEGLRDSWVQAIAITKRETVSVTRCSESVMLSSLAVSG